MRSIPIAVLLALSCPFAHLISEEPVRAPKEPDSERIGDLIRQLDSDDYATREQTTRQLISIGLPAKAELLAARQSGDAEVRQRVEQVLRSIEVFEAQEVFLAAMKGSWQEGLKDGRVTGPLLGVARANGSVIPVDLSAFAAERPAGAVNLSLWFLSRTQGKDGAWSSRTLGAELNADVDQTSLALLAILGAGHTEKVGLYKGNVQRAVAWLKTRQRQDGAILNEGWTQVDGITQALVTMALSEAADMANVPDTTTAAQRALDFLIRGQGKTTGGFGRRPDLVADLLTSTFGVLALKSAKVAGLDVPAASFEGAVRFLDSVEDKEAKSYRHVPQGKPSANATILGLLARQMLGWKKEDLAETAAAALRTIGEPTLNKDNSDVLTNYFATLVAFHQGGEVWTNWNEAMKRHYLSGQVQEGPSTGAWPPKGVWGGGGYILSTALGSLNLCVYFRYLPVFRKDLDNK